MLPLSRFLFSFYFYLYIYISQNQIVRLKKILFHYIFWVYVIFPFYLVCPLTFFFFFFSYPIFLSPFPSLLSSFLNLTFVHDSSTFFLFLSLFCAYPLLSFFPSFLPSFLPFLPSFLLHFLHCHFLPLSLFNSFIDFLFSFFSLTSITLSFQFILPFLLSLHPPYSPSPSTFPHPHTPPRPASRRHVPGNRKVLLYVCFRMTQRTHDALLPRFSVLLFCTFFSAVKLVI